MPWHALSRLVTLIGMTWSPGSGPSSDVTGSAGRGPADPRPLTWEFVQETLHDHGYIEVGIVNGNIHDFVSNQLHIYFEWDATTNRVIDYVEDGNGQFFNGHGTDQRDNFEALLLDYIHNL